MTNLSYKVSRAYIGMGSNIGDRAGHLRVALTALQQLGRVKAVSSLYETSAVGSVRQADFLNAVAELRTELSPEPLLRELLRIEREHGRDRNVGPAKGPRTLDLDLLALDDSIFKSAMLTVPHPALAQRRFVLVPLTEIAPEWRHPETGKTAANLLAELERTDAGRSQRATKIFPPPQSS